MECILKSFILFSINFISTFNFTIDDSIDFKFIFFFFFGFNMLCTRHIQRASNRNDVCIMRACMHALHALCTHIHTENEDEHDHELP